MMLRNLLNIFCILAILGDTLYSYLQHYNEPLDGVTLTGRPTGIVSWSAPARPEDSETAGRLLHLWNVTDREKKFYFPHE